MLAVSATAPGKVILFGEHAVVYGRPAIAVPVTQVRATATVVPEPGFPPGQVRIFAADIHLDSRLADLPADHPLAMAVTATTRQLGISSLPAFRVQISSTIPIASGLGSGAAVSVAIARAVSAFVGRPLSDEDVSAVAYQVDQQYHGTPSGIDNTVIAYAQPVFYVRGQPFERLRTGQSFTIVIGNSGVSSPTARVVGDVRRRWQLDPVEYENLFDRIGDIANRARQIIESGPAETLGPLMDENQRLLQTLDVSSPELDRLVSAALAAGAAGAKLWGGGRGGNMIALVTPATAGRVTEELHKAGAVKTLITTVENQS
jgi:mevalonate kinase